MQKKFKHIILRINYPDVHKTRKRHGAECFHLQAHYFSYNLGTVHFQWEAQIISIYCNGSQLWLLL